MWFRNPMDRQINQVTEFHQRIGESVSKHPCLLQNNSPADIVISERLRAIVHLFVEGQEPPSQLARRALMAVEELAEWIEAHASGDLVAAADALGDRLYVLMGDAVATGMPAEDIFDEVHRSNLTKATANRATGKGIKGDDFKSPNLQTIIARKLSC